MIGALLLGACSTEESSTPASVIPTEATTTTTLPPTTTAAPTTTVASTTTTPTTPPPTLPPPGPPVPDRVDLFVGGAEPDAGWLALGHWSGTEWEDGADQPTSGSPVRITSLSTGVGDAMFGDAAPACTGQTGPTIAADRPAVEPPGSGYGYVAVGGEWSPHPRPRVRVEADVPRYRALAEQLLADEPVDPENGSVVEFLLADLDADGTEEAVLVFEYVQDAGRSTPGDFSVLMLVDTTSATPTAISRSVVPPLPPPPTTDPEASSTVAQVPPVPEALERARVLDIVDLNGDGRMELITRAWSSAGSGAVVTTYRDRTVDTVLDASCAS